MVKVAKTIKELELTIPQAASVLSTARMKYHVWARGAGKSFILAYYMKEFARQMPRGSFFLVGATYSQILFQTLPSTIEGMEKLGLIQGVHYVVGRSGKKEGFPMPYQPPSKWQNVIHFCTGAVFVLISLDNPNSGRGFNTSGGIGDEALTFDEGRLYSNAQATNRSRREIFGDCPLLGAEVYMTSMPITKKGKWILKYEERALVKPNDYYFSMATAKTNHSLPKEYFERAKENAASQMLYEAEFLNICPKEITDGFYANLRSDKHYITDYDNNYLVNLEGVPLRSSYNCNQDNDLDKDQPLIVSLDFGVFNSCVVMQKNTERNEIRVLKDFWAKSPKITNDLFLEDFLPYYEPHQEKKIYLYGGHDGHNRTANSSTTLYQQIEKLLREHGWKVYVMAKPAAPMHSKKYMLINTMLKESMPKLPKIRINQHNCKDLIISLERAEAIEGKTGIEKQKKDERNKSMLQQHTTHLTDAFDYPLYDMYWDIYNGGRSIMGESLITFR